jgi:hypothetical protein
MFVNKYNFSTSTGVTEIFHVRPAIAARRDSPINGAAENDNHICMTIIIITFNKKASL